MPSKKRASSVTAGDDYDSDGGFVEDAPRSKKAKKEKKRRGWDKEDESIVRDVGGGKAGKDGEVYWEVSPPAKLNWGEDVEKLLTGMRLVVEQAKNRRARVQRE